MGNTVARSHIRDADRGVAKATRANTRRNSTNVPAPPPLISTSTASTSSSPPEDQTLPEPNPRLSENRHSFTFGIDSPDASPVKRRARHVSAEAAYLEPSGVSIPDPAELPPSASPAEAHAARTETPPRVDKPPRARKVVSFNENVHVVTYPYEGSNHSSAELPAITRYPEPKHGRRRSRSVFRLLSRAPQDHQGLAYDACCGLRIASDAQVVYDDQPTSDDRLLSFDSSKDLYDNGLVVSYERPYSDAVADDFDYVHREEEEEDNDTFSLPDAHPSCDAIVEPEAIGDQLLTRDDTRDAPAFDIAPLWQRLKRVDELDAVAKNTFLRESARRRKVHDAKPPRPPKRDAPGISHSRASRVKARRASESVPPKVADKRVTRGLTSSEGGSREKLVTDAGSFRTSVSERIPQQTGTEDSVDAKVTEDAENARQSSPTKSITPPFVTPNTSPNSSTAEHGLSSQSMPPAAKEPDPAQERRIPAPARSRATSAGSIQKHMASFTTESAASTDRDIADEPSLKDDMHAQEYPFAPSPMIATTSAVTVEPKSEKNLPPPKAHDVTCVGRNRVRSEPHDVGTEAQPLATSIRTSRSARVAGSSRAAPDEAISFGIRARATVRPVEDPTLPETSPSGENISHSWARLNDLARKPDNPTTSGSKRSLSAPTHATLADHPHVHFSEDGNDREPLSTDRESDRASTMDLDFDPLSLPMNDDYGISPCAPVQGYAPVAGVYYGNSSPSVIDPGSPRLGLADTADLADYPEYEMLNGNVNDDSLFESEPDTPILGTKSNWAEPFDEAFFGLEDDMRTTPRGIRGDPQRDRNARQPVPEVLLHDWSGSTPVEPNVEMIDSAPNSRSSASHLFTDDDVAEVPKQDTVNAAAILSKRMNVDTATLYQSTAFKADVEPIQPKRGGGVSSNSVAEKIGSEKGMSNLRRSRSDRITGAVSEFDAPVKHRVHGKGKRIETTKKISLSNTEAWVSSDYEVKEPENRAKSDAHEPNARAFFPALPVGYAPDPKLQDFQLSVERKSVSEMGYRKAARTGRGTSFVDRELTGERGLPGGALDETWRDGKQEHAQKRLALSQRRRRPSDAENAGAAGRDEGGTLRGMMGRLVSGMHMAKRLVTPN